jgi:tetratricopeptide (TPR) repeat protein
MKTLKYIGILAAMLMVLTPEPMRAQAWQQLQDACPGCTPNIPQVPPPTCVECEASGSESAPAVMSIDAYNIDLTQVYVQSGTKEYDKGTEAYNRKEWNKAISHFRKALKFIPRNATIQASLDQAIAQRDAENAHTAAMADYQRRLAEYNRALAEKKEADSLFLLHLNEDESSRKTQLSRLEHEISLVPPLTPVTKKRIHEGVILGVMNTRDNNSATGLVSPWSGKPYKEDSIFTCTYDSTWTDIFRGLLDNSYPAEITLLTPAGRELVRRIQGTHFDRLVAHSNGATIAEALIRKGIITVNELDVVGGDRAYINFFGWNELISSGTVARVVVWSNPRDPIPLGSSILPLLNKYSNRSEYENNLVSFAMDKVLGSKGGHNAEYKLLDGPGYEAQEWKKNTNIDKVHGFKVYVENLAREFSRPASSGN